MWRFVFSEKDAQGKSLDRQLSLACIGLDTGPIGQGRLQRTSRQMLVVLSLTSGHAVYGQSAPEPQYPRHWPVVATAPVELRIVTESVKRFGPTLHFATAQAGGASIGQMLNADPSKRLGISFNWYWMKCANEWIAQVRSEPSYVMSSVPAERQYSELSTWSPNPWAIEFWHLTDPRSPGRSEELRRVALAMCRVAPASATEIEIPIAEGAGFVELLLLRTLEQRGSQVQGWIRRAQTKERLIADQDGKPVNGPRGVPLTIPEFSIRPPLARFKAHADCSARTAANSRLTTFAPDGSAQTSAPSGPLKWEEPIPGTVEEKVYMALCNVVTAPGTPARTAPKSKITSSFEVPGRTRLNG